jgi:hypothetical protein
MADNQSVYEYLFSSQELLDSGDLGEKESGILIAKMKSIYTLLGVDEGDLE